MSEVGFAQGNNEDKGEALFNGPGAFRTASLFFLEERKISWTAWNFSRIWTPNLLEEDNEDDEYIPTESGAFYKAQLMEATTQGD